VPAALFVIDAKNAQQFVRQKQQRLPTVSEGSIEVPWNFHKVTGAYAEYTSVDGLPYEGMFKEYLESPPGTIKSTGEPAFSRYWESSDGTGMWRQSNHWGGLGNSTASLNAADGSWIASPAEFKMTDMVMGHVYYRDVKEFGSMTLNF
jgi:hypothetical protein